MSRWDATDLRKSLEALKAKGKILNYVASENVTDRQEYYLIQSAGARAALDQAREVSSHKTFAKVTVAKEGGRQGSAEKPLLSHYPLEDQLQALCGAAALGDQQAWEMPQPTKPLGSVNNVYPEIKEDPAKGASQLLKTLQSAVSDTKGIFNSAELFVNLEKIRSFASNGFEAAREQSKIYTEVCFSAEDKASKVSEEFLLTDWYAHPKQSDLKYMSSNSLLYATASLRTEKPQSGNYHVILPSEVLNTIWNDCMDQLDSASQYYKMPFLEKGTEFIKDFSGDAFTLSKNALLDFSFASRTQDAIGQAQKNLLLVSGNHVQEHLTDARMSQYLKKPQTSTAGTVVITPATTTSVENLRKSQPRVLEILQFSGLFSDPMTLTFSSEIRLARLYDNETGKVFYVKGGNLSGNLMENFRTVRWSKEQRMINYTDYGQAICYQGPGFALVGNVSVSC